MANWQTLDTSRCSCPEVYDERVIKFVITGDAVLRGWRDKDGLWCVPMQDGVRPGQSPSSIALLRDQLRNNLFDMPSIEQGIRFVHACCGFPTKATWLKAIRKDNFVGWPLVTVENVNKYLPESEETQKGHMNHQRQGVRSTKPKAVNFEDVDKSLTYGIREKNIYIKVVEVSNTIYTDQTGRFPVTSSSGHYIMIMVEIDSNVILAEPMKSKRDDEMQRA